MREDWVSRMPHSQWTQANKSAQNTAINVLGRVRGSGDASLVRRRASARAAECTVFTFLVLSTARSVARVGGSTALVNECGDDKWWLKWCDAPRRLRADQSCACVPWRHTINERSAAGL